MFLLHFGRAQGHCQSTYTPRCLLPSLGLSLIYQSDGHWLYKLKIFCIIWSFPLEMLKIKLGIFCIQSSGFTTKLFKTIFKKSYLLVRLPLLMTPQHPRIILRQPCLVDCSALEPPTKMLTSSSPKSDKWIHEYKNWPSFTSWHKPLQSSNPLPSHLLKSLPLSPSILFCLFHHPSICPSPEFSVLWGRSGSFMRALLGSWYSVSPEWMRS